nr:DUF2599 domain-containing protein [Gordonia desulfuricans]
MNAERCPRRTAARAQIMSPVVALGIALGVVACGDDAAPTDASSTGAPPGAVTTATTVTSTGDTSGAATGAVPATDAAHPPPYVDHVEWVQTAVGPSLQVHPTPAGRKTYSADGADVAWAEVLAADPGADTPGMRAQFDCHWTYARLVAPDKPSWNLEPRRPVVTQQEMAASRCNPGGPEE